MLTGRAHGAHKHQGRPQQSCHAHLAHHDFRPCLTGSKGGEEGNGTEWVGQVGKRSNKYKIGGTFSIDDLICKKQRVGAVRFSNFRLISRLNFCKQASFGVSLSVARHVRRRLPICYREGQREQYQPRGYGKMPFKENIERASHDVATEPRLTVPNTKILLDTEPSLATNPGTERAPTSKYY